jgi:hypothetical protein
MDRKPPIVCPYCQSTDVTLLMDRHGPVCWCDHCRHAWIPSASVLPKVQPQRHSA